MAETSIDLKTLKGKIIISNKTDIEIMNLKRKKRLTITEAISEDTEEEEASIEEDLEADLEEILPEEASEEILPEEDLEETLPEAEVAVDLTLGAEEDIIDTMRIIIFLILTLTTRIKDKMMNISIKS
jgi:hypothetical protein